RTQIDAPENRSNQIWQKAEHLVGKFSATSLDELEDALGADDIQKLLANINKYALNKIGAEIHIRNDMAVLSEMGQAPVVVLGHHKPAPAPAEESEDPVTHELSPKEYEKAENIAAALVAESKADPRATTTKRRGKRDHAEYTRETARERRLKIASRFIEAMIKHKEGVPTAALTKHLNYVGLTAEDLMGKPLKEANKALKTVGLQIEVRDGKLLILTKKEEKLETPKRPRGSRKKEVEGIQGVEIPLREGLKNLPEEFLILLDRMGRVYPHLKRNYKRVGAIMRVMSQFHKGIHIEDIPVLLKEQYKVRSTKEQAFNALTNIVDNLLRDFGISLQVEDGSEKARLVLDLEGNKELKVVFEAFARNLKEKEAALKLRAERAATLAERLQEKNTAAMLERHEKRAAYLESIKIEGTKREEVLAFAEEKLAKGNYRGGGSYKYGAIIKEIASPTRKPITRMGLISILSLRYQIEITKADLAKMINNINLNELKPKLNVKILAHQDKLRMVNVIEGDKDDDEDSED
ncbi:hypothetical protein HOE67_00125, partial [Candidatus Peregrinibacteria bacterium]|nr:hypothetical protein [Candidatus Peregrinibacteria bacterium]